eukprot:g30468.t1
MAAADVQWCPLELHMAEHELERTGSQVLKQMKVQQVQHRLTQLQEQASVESQQRLPSLVEQQKIARNLGEDLMEEMLKLDSLGNLCEDDRQVRKKALADLESLVEQVDAAKALLLQQRLQLEAGSERWGNGDGVPVRRADVGGKPGVLDGPCAPGP